MTVIEQILAQNAQILAQNERLIAQMQADAPAHVTSSVASSQVSAPEAPTTKPLSRGAWKALRTTKAGKVRKEFAGLTREQAFEAGLCPGFHLPTGARQEAIREYNARLAA